MSEGTRKNQSKLGKIGLIFTGLYLIGIALFQWENLTTLHLLELNEFGDFLAGAFGPLAIFWLVLGFFQQGKELKNSTQALELQSKELRDAVMQQKELVGVTREALDFERKAAAEKERKRKQDIQPKFVFTISAQLQGSRHDTGQASYSAKVENFGMQANQVRLRWLHPKGQLETTGYRGEFAKDVWPKGETAEFDLFDDKLIDVIREKFLINVTMFDLEDDFVQYYHEVRPINEHLAVPQLVVGRVISMEELFDH